MGVWSEFPINGFDFIQGNNNKGGKVYPVSKVVNVPISESDNVAVYHLDLFVASVLTRAEGCTQVQEVKLADSILASALSE